MKSFKILVVILLLTPMVSFGQEYDFKKKDFSTRLQRELDSLSVKLYNLVVNKEVNAFNSLELDVSMNNTDFEYSTRGFEEVISVQDPNFSYDSFATIDSTISTPFNKNDLNGLCFGYKIKQDVLNVQSTQKLIAISPLRQTAFPGIDFKEAMFWIKLEELKQHLSQREMLLLIFFSKFGHNEKGVIDLGYSFLSDTLKHNYLDTVKNTLLDENVNDELVSRIRELNNNELPSFFSDSLLKMPIRKLIIDSTYFYTDTCEHWLSTGVIDLRLLEDFTFTLKNDFIEIKSFRFVDFADCHAFIAPKREQFHKMYCKQEDFLPFLPEWLQLLMKEVYIEEK